MSIKKVLYAHHIPHFIRVFTYVLSFIFKSYSFSISLEGQVMRKKRVSVTKNKKLYKRANDNTIKLKTD